RSPRRLLWRFLHRWPILSFLVLPRWAAGHLGRQRGPGVPAPDPPGVRCTDRGPRRLLESRSRQGREAILPVRGPTGLGRAVPLRNQYEAAGTLHAGYPAGRRELLARRKMDRLFGRAGT